MQKESLSEKCPNTEFFLVHTFPDLDWLRRISLYSVQMRNNTDHKNSVFGDFSRSESVDYLHFFPQKAWYQQKQIPEVFCKKGLLKNFAKLTRKHLCQGLVL